MVRIQQRRTIGLAFGIAAAILPSISWAERPTNSPLTQASPSDRPASGSTVSKSGEAVSGNSPSPLPTAVAQPSLTVATATTSDGGRAVAVGKQEQNKLNESMKNAYKGVFYANNYSYLDSPAYDGPYFLGDNLKGMAAGKLDVGGEYRSRYHHENNMRGFGLTGVDDQFWLTRLRLFSNYRITENIRVYGEYLYADSGGETFAPRAIEENRGEAQNLFVDAKLFETGAGTVSARVGRQELLLGEQRLVSPLDWANTRRTFDGYRLTYASQELDADLFYTNPVNRVTATGGTNEWDSSNNNTSFYGAYLSRKGMAVGVIDAYYLGYDNQDANFSYHTLGSRLAGAGDYFLYELEGGVQFGANANGNDHGAGFMTAGLGRKMELSLAGKDWNPTIWGWYDWASGGDSEFIARGDNSFDHNFPLAHKYNGLMDLFGRRNLNDVNMQFTTPMGDKVNLLLWYHYFFLDQATTPYSVLMTPFNAGNTAGSKDLGHEIDLLCTVNMDPRNSLLLGYSYFAAGRYYDTTAGVPTNSDADFFYMQYQTRF